MNAKTIENLLNKIAPPPLAYKGDELGFIFGDKSKKISTIGVTWRPTLQVLKQAAKNNVNLLIIHEPLFQSKKNFLFDAKLLKYPPNLKREKILKQNKILVYRYHSQWDDAKEGNNDVLVRLLNLKDITKIPYGRIGKIKPCLLKEFINYVKKQLECKTLLVTSNNLNKKISKVGVVSGSGNSLTEIIEIVKQKGADVLLSGDIQDSRARFATELGLILIDAGGYYTETPGMKNLAKILQQNFSIIKVVYLDPGPPWQVK